MQQLTRLIRSVPWCVPRCTRVAPNRSQHLHLDYTPLDCSQLEDAVSEAHYQHGGVPASGAAFQAAARGAGGGCWGVGWGSDVKSAAHTDLTGHLLWGSNV